MPTPHRSFPAPPIPAVLVCLALAGCASPYVEPSDLPSHPETPPTTLDEARALLQARHAAYRQKIVSAGQEEQSLSNGLITLGGLLLGMGTADVHVSAIRGTALAGGLGYALGTNNIDKRRATIYRIGMKALECADDAIAPIAFSKEVVKQIGTLDSAVDEKMQTLQAAVADATAATLALPAGTPADDPTLKAAQAGLDKARQAMEQATAARSAAQKLLQRRASAGGQLAAAVRAIDTDVLDGIRSTEVSLQAIPGIVGKLASDVTIFSNVAKSVPVPAAGAARTGSSADTGTSSRASGGISPQQVEWLFRAVGTLAGATQSTGAAADLLVDVIKDIEAGFTPERLKTCKVDNLPVVMSVTPARLSFKAKTADTQILTLKGGKPAYAARFVQSSHPGLTIEAASPFMRSDVIVVNATKDAVDGTYQILIRDAADQLQTVQVSVTASDAPVPSVAPMGSAAGAGPAASPARQAQGRMASGQVRFGPVVAQLSGDQIAVIQAALCMREDWIDGLWGLRTQAALLKRRERQEAAGARGLPQGFLTAEEASTLLARKPSEIAGDCKS